MSFRYARWVNRREKRSGHLFQGRYKEVLVDGESYLHLVGYIHLNPIRARDIAQSFTTVRPTCLCRAMSVSRRGYSRKRAR